MSQQGDKVVKQIDALRGYIKERLSSCASNDLEFLEGMLDAIENLNLRLQVIEREIGPSDAFIDPTQGSHRIS